jgi:hypothetical protein
MNLADDVADDLAERLARDGFAVVPGVLSATEVEALRRDVDGALASGSIPYGLGAAAPDAATGAPGVRWVLHRPAIVAAVRQALAVEGLLFTMEAGVHRNVTGPWHKDTGEHAFDGGYFGRPDPWADDECRVVKVGLYLQDHLDGTGLRVRRGSHRRGDLESGKEVVVRTRAGDAVIFDARITHRGQAPTRIDQAVALVARVLPRRSRQQVVAATRSKLNAARGRPDRLAVFFAFGPRTAPVEMYGRRNLERQLQQLQRPPRAVDPALERALQDLDVEILTFVS